MTKRTRVLLRLIALVLAGALAATVMKLIHPDPAPLASVPVTRPASQPAGPVIARMVGSIRPGMTQDQVRAILGPPQLTNTEMNNANQRLLLRAGKEPSKAVADPARSGWFYKAGDGGVIGVGFKNHIVTLVTAAPH